MIHYFLPVLTAALTFAGIHSSRSAGNMIYRLDSVQYKSEKLSIKKISSHVYQHISFLETEDFGKVPCNGMIVVNDRKAVVFDTPAKNTASEELIRYVEEELGSKIEAVISTHFHADCLGGLKAFHEHKIPSYSNRRTLTLLKVKDPKAVRPQNVFDDSLELEIGNEKVISVYLGEGHTTDNIVGYFPAEHVLFGGCLIKESGATKGNLADANVEAWPKTVGKVKDKFPDVKIVIPGHGNLGGRELLDYTMRLFE